MGPSPLRLRVYFATTDGHLSSEDIGHADPSTWPPFPTTVSPTEVIFKDIHPEAKAKYTEFACLEGEDAPDVYYKMLQVVQFRWLLNLAYTRTREIQNCEYLRQYKHPNFAEYRGVYSNNKLNYQAQSKPVKIPLDKELVTMLVFKRYDCNLAEAIANRDAIDVAQCLRSIRTGLAYLHIWGMVHSNIKPENIFVLYPKAGGEGLEATTQYVIGDFDSAQITGNPMTGKMGTAGWAKSKKERDVIEEEDDWYAFRELEDWLVASQKVDVMEVEGRAEIVVGKQTMKGITSQKLLEVRG